MKTTTTTTSSCDTTTSTPAAVSTNMMTDLNLSEDMIESLTRVNDETDDDEKRQLKMLCKHLYDKLVSSEEEQKKNEQRQLDDDKNNKRLLRNNEEIVVATEKEEEEECNDGYDAKFVVNETAKDTTKKENSSSLLVQQRRRLNLLRNVASHSLQLQTELSIATEEYNELDEDLSSAIVAYTQLNQQNQVLMKAIDAMSSEMFNERDKYTTLVYELWRSEKEEATNAAAAAAVQKVLQKIESEFEYHCQHRQQLRDVERKEDSATTTTMIDDDEHEQHVHAHQIRQLNLLYRSFMGRILQLILLIFQKERQHHHQEQQLNEKNEKQLVTASKKQGKLKNTTIIKELETKVKKLETKIKKMNHELQNNANNKRQSTVVVKELEAEVKKLNTMLDNANSTNADLVGKLVSLVDVNLQLTHANLQLTNCNQKLNEDLRDASYSRGDEDASTGKNDGSTDLTKVPFRYRMLPPQNCLPYYGLMWTDKNGFDRYTMYVWLFDGMENRHVHYAINKGGRSISIWMHFVPDFRVLGDAQGGHLLSVGGSSVTDNPEYRENLQQKEHAVYDQNFCRDGCRYKHPVPPGSILEEEFTEDGVQPSGVYQHDGRINLLVLECKVKRGN